MLLATLSTRMLNPGLLSEVASYDVARAISARPCRGGGEAAAARAGPPTACTWCTGRQLQPPLSRLDGNNSRRRRRRREKEVGGG